MDEVTAVPEKVLSKKPRNLLPTEFKTGYLEYSATIKCPCKHEVTLFHYTQDPDNKCQSCGRKYEVKLSVKTYPPTA